MAKNYFQMLYFLNKIPKADFQLFYAQYIKQIIQINMANELFVQHITCRIFTMFVSTFYLNNKAQNQTNITLPTNVDMVEAYV